MMLASGQGSAFTTPVGYHTETAQPGFNVIGVNLVDAPLVSSALTAIAGETLTDTNVDFTAALAEGDLYTIEFDNGAWSEIASWTATTVTTTENLMARLDPTAANNSYIVRKVRTVSDFFGPANEAGLKEGTATDADVIWVPVGDIFEKLYYTQGDGLIFTQGWKAVSTQNDDQAEFPIHFNKGLIVQRRGAGPIDLTFTGHVKLTPTDIDASAPFTYISRVYPTGGTLGNSGFYTDGGANSFQAGTATTATIVWLPQGPGVFEKGYYTLGDGLIFTEGWKLVSTQNDDQAGAELTSGMIIQKNKDAFSLTLTPPDFYADL
jgi:hypothetical protein